jgi:ABC-type sugar transport system substrate-binding protein
MAPIKVVLCVADQANEYQETVIKDAAAAATRAGFTLDVCSGDDRVTQQIRQIYECMHADAEQRPKAIIVMPVRVNSLERVAREAVQSGIGWISLHRRMESLAGLRQEFPDVPISFVSPNQREIGEIQGRQFRALLPKGGQLLYVTGEATSPPAQQRLEGLTETIKGSGVKLAGVLDGNWSTSDAERVVGSWLRIVMSGNSRIDLVGCQNDRMAVGVLKALATVGDYLKRDDLKQTPVTGCDGVPSVGQKLVDEKQLAATVIVPSSGTPAIDMLAAAFNHGKMPPPELLLSATSYPAERGLKEKLARAK